MGIEENKSAEMLEKIRDLFMTYGIKSLTMDDIARHLSISKKTLYKYVKDKNDLVKQVMQTAIDEEECMLTTIENSDGNAIDKLFAINQMVSMKLQAIHPSVIYDIQKYYPEAWDIMQQHKNECIHQQVVDNINEGIEEGLYRDNLNPEIIATIYGNLVGSMFNPESTLKGKYSITDIHAEVARYHLKAIANPTGVKYIQELFKKYHSNLL